METEREWPRVVGAAAEVNAASGSGTTETIDALTCEVYVHPQARRVREATPYADGAARADGERVKAPTLSALGYTA